MRKPSVPSYRYEQTAILDACHTLQAQLSQFSFIYSIKTNPFYPIIQTVAKEGFGADAASKEEVFKSLRAGIPAEKIYYSTPGRRKEDLEDTWGKCVFIADSLHEIEMMQAIAKEKGAIAEIGLRIHPMFVMDSGMRGASKFGIDIKNISELKRLLENCPNIKVVGFHIHLKSQLLNAEVLGKYYHNVMNTAKMLSRELDAKIRFINFGSGIGVVYDKEKDTPVDLAKLRSLTDELVKENEETLGAELIIETGRFIVCHAGTYVTEVLDKKVSQGITYLVVANGMNGFLRPAIANLISVIAKDTNVPRLEPLFTSENEFTLRVLNGATEQEVVTVVGNLCTALDIIRADVMLNKAEIGDLVEIDNAGSYAYSLSPLLFSSQTLPKQYMHTIDDAWIEE